MQGGGGGGGWVGYLLHFKPLQKLSVSPCLTLCLLSAGCRRRRRRVIKHGSRQQRAEESWLHNTVLAALMGRTDIMKPSAVRAWHQLMILMPERRTRCWMGAEAEFAAHRVSLPQAASSASALIAALLGGSSPSLRLSCLP